MKHAAYLILGLLVPFAAVPQSVAQPRTEPSVLTVELIDAKGRAHTIGQLALEPAADSGRIHYRWELDHHRTTDHFLSMKEMKCLEGPELWCYIPYPYANPHWINRDDLRWLEHDLLFLFKRKGEFGANFWNGIYYRLEWQQDGSLAGEARALDLNLLASPPEDPSLPPIGEFDLEEADILKRWLPRVRAR